MKLSDICEIIVDCEHKTAPTQETGYPSIRTPNVGRGYFILDDVNRVSYETYKLWTRRAIPQAGDLIMAREAPVGNVAIIPNGIQPCLGQRTVLLRCNTLKVVPRYLVYYLLGPEIQSKIFGMASGVTIPHLNMEDIRDLQLDELPSITTQRKIGAILSAYDDLIANNRRRTKILEEMAQMIYREWFAHYRFPGHENVRMVDSGTALGMVPEGWEGKRVGDVLDTIETGSRPKGGIDPSERGVPSIGAENIIGLGEYDYSKEKYVGNEFYDNMKSGHIKKGDVLLYKDGAKIGRKSLFRDDFPHERCCVNEHVFILRANELCNQSYLYFWLDQPEMTRNIQNLNANAAQPGINQNSVKGLQILIPENNLLDYFDKNIEPYLSLLFNLAKKNVILQKTRDILLPKLISGELDVSELEISIDLKEDE